MLIQNSQKQNEYSILPLFLFCFNFHRQLVVVVYDYHSRNPSDLLNLE